MGRIYKLRTWNIILTALFLLSIMINIFQHSAIVALLDAENSRDVIISQDILKVISECKHGN